MSVLAVENLKVHFGGVHALDGVTLRMRERGVHALIGPNGAGKTTLINAITGIYPPSEGRVLLGQHDITGLPAHRLASMGITRTFQNLQVFWTMSVLENVMTGFHLVSKAGCFRSLVRTPGLVRRERELRDKAFTLLEDVGLSARAETMASALAYGELKRLELARALAAEPRFLFLDEPVAGCTVAERRRLGEVIRRLSESTHTTVVLVEHDMRLVMEISDYVTVLVQGRVLTQDLPSRVQQDPEVIAAYLGVSRLKQEPAHAAN